MSSFNVSASSSGNFAIHPQQVVAARCTRIIDLGTQVSTYKGDRKEAHKVLIQWESEALMEDGEHAGKPFLISQRYTASLNEKATLRRDLESWRGRKFTPLELEKFDLKNLLGKACMINVVHNDAEGGKTYANIGSIMPLPGSMKANPAVGDLVFFSFESFDADVFAKLSEGVQKTIGESKEMKQAGRPAAAAEPASREPGSDDNIDDADIPF